MTVSRAFWKIVLKNIGTVITYTIVLLLFGTMNISSGSTTTQYEAEKPNIVVFNHDEERGVTKHFIDYLGKNADIVTNYEDNDRLKDALFYSQVNLVVDIPENFHQDIALGYNPEIKLRSSTDYASELAKVQVRRYLSVAETYAAMHLSEDELVNKIDGAMKTETKIEVKSTVDTAKFSKAYRYYSFANYSILCCVIMIVCLIMASFNRIEVRRRNLVSSIELGKMNRILLRNSCIYSALVWLLYVVISVVVLGADVMFTGQGLLFALNAFVFSACATTIAILVSRFISKTTVVNGVMLVISIGSSFLCGAFVPAEYMPDAVLAFAHALPSYYYIYGNEQIRDIENFEFNSLAPILLNMAIVLAFSVVFVIVANIVSKKRQKIA